MQCHACDKGETKNTHTQNNKYKKKKTNTKKTNYKIRIAQRLKEAQNTAASLTTFNEIDMFHIINLRNKYKDQFAEKHGFKLG